MANETTAQPMITSIEGTVLAVKLDHMKEQMAGILAVMEKMQSTLSLLATIEQQQRDFRGALDRAFAEIKIEREKVAAMMLEMPQYRSLRRWAIGGAIACMGMLGTTMFTLLVIQPLYRGYGIQPQGTTNIITPAQNGQKQ